MVEVIVSVMERPRPAVVGGAGRVMVALHRHLPRLAEAVVGALGARAQKSG